MSQKIETIKMNLEQVMGLTIFVDMYQLIQTKQPIPPQYNKYIQFVPFIKQLLVLEDNVYS